MKKNSKLKNKITSNIKKIVNSKKLMLFTILIILFTSCIITLGIQTVIKVKRAEKGYNFGYEILCQNEDDTFKILITAESPEGIEYIQFPDGDKLYAKGKYKVGIDYEIAEGFDYKFNIKETDKDEREEIIRREITQVEGNYELVDGIYVNTPDLTGFVKENTRYLYQNEQQKLIPGNWLTHSEPQNWYSYRNRQWANIYVETNGVESYYVWIPRYMYKIDTENSIAGNERTDIKFVNNYNEYKDKEGNITTYEELLEQGYKLPEAFTWRNSEDYKMRIPGYWMSKYQLSELEEYKLDYNLSASEELFSLSDFTNNVSENATKYTYALNGIIVHESEVLEDYLIDNITPEQDNIINITALDSDGSILGSMTKIIYHTEVNPPDLTGFDKDTTFYVYWDDNGIEHNEIPISQEPPQNWYNYTYSKWANIVTRNDGLESYFVWIPRYEYVIDNTSERANIQFISGTEINTNTNYKIPEAFTWGDEGEKQLTGYWISKYQLSQEEVTAKLRTELSAGSNLIRVGDITGTALKSTNEDGEEIDVPLKYEYYLNGEKVHEGTSNTERFIFERLNSNTFYTINIIARNSITNAYVGAITQKIKTVEPYEPDLTGFNKDCTFYVIFNDDGTEKERISINEEMPDNWYDYSNRKWANIVTTANNTESYFVWIPRYEYKILEDRTNESLENRRVDINFITTNITNENSTIGYKVPEAFTWGDEGEKQLTGYWMSKYQLNE